MDRTKLLPYEEGYNIGQNLMHENMSNLHIVFDVFIGLVVAGDDQTLGFVPLFNLWREGGGDENSTEKAHIIHVPCGTSV